MPLPDGGLDDDGQRHAVESADVNAYLRESFYHAG